MLFKRWVDTPASVQIEIDQENMFQGAVFKRTLFRSLVRPTSCDPLARFWLKQTSAHERDVATSAAPVTQL